MVANTGLRVLSPTWKEAPVPFVTSADALLSMQVLNVEFTDRPEAR